MLENKLEIIIRYNDKDYCSGIKFSGEIPENEQLKTLLSYQERTLDKIFNTKINK